MSTQTIINADFKVAMEGMGAGSVDLIVTDPPYGMDYQSSWRTDKYEKIANDITLEWVKPFFAECFRVLKDNSHIYAFCNDYAISEFRNAMEEVGFTPKRTLVWVKNNHTSGDLEGDYGNKTEFLLYAQKGRRELNGTRDTNVLNYSRVASELHPTQKPTELISFLIVKSSNENDTILDPFMGSGTTLVACKHLNRNCVGIEISEKYCAIAQERLDSTPTPMF
jgi:site-specific DNA-methyltransferase (adenine-specific)